MNIEFNCPGCGKQIKTVTSFAGRKARCVACKAEFTVPEEQHRSKAPKRAPSFASSSIPLTPTPQHPDDLIDMTAMVDIVFFLLIFFLVTSMQSLESVMEMPTPEVAEETAGEVQTVARYENDPTCIVVQIDSDDSVWIDGEQIYGEQDLRVKLRQLTRKSKVNSALIIGHADASHGKAVLVFDSCATEGLSKLSFTVQEDLDI